MKNVFFITKVDGNVLNKYKVALLHKNERALCKLSGGSCKEKRYLRSDKNGAFNSVQSQRAFLVRIIFT